MTKKPKNTGKPYELLTQRIFHEILNQKAVNTINVEDNVKIQGKSTTHQIDVSWEFEAGGISYRTLVQCKDRGTELVKQGELLTFKAVLDDIPGQPRGVFVARTGYQSGAIEVAKSNGILIYELREPTKKDFGGITSIQAKIYVSEPQLVSAKLIYDEKWLLEQKQSLKMTVNITQFEDVRTTRHRDHPFRRIVITRFAPS